MEVDIVIDHLLPEPNKARQCCQKFSSTFSLQWPAFSRPPSRKDLEVTHMVSPILFLVQMTWSQVPCCYSALYFDSLIQPIILHKTRKNQFFSNISFQLFLKKASILSVLWYLFLPTYKYVIWIKLVFSLYTQHKSSLHGLARTFRWVHSPCPLSAVWPVPTWGGGCGPWAGKGTGPLKRSPHGAGCLCLLRCVYSVGLSRRTRGEFGAVSWCWKVFTWFHVAVESAAGIWIEIRCVWLPEHTCWFSKKPNWLSPEMSSERQEQHDLSSRDSAEGNDSLPSGASLSHKRNQVLTLSKWNPVINADLILGSIWSPQDKPDT